MTTGLTAAIAAAAGGFAAATGGALYLGRRHQERAGFAALVAAPVVAALSFAAAMALRAPVTPLAADPPPPPAAESTPTMSPEPTSVAPVALARPARELNPQAARWRSEADQLRRDRRFAEARDLYAKITRAAPTNADAWADLADTTAAAAGGDLKAAGAAIDRALLADPDHPKALWLKASLELQEKRYTNAMELWRHLLGRLPPGSNDAKVVSANLEETRALAARLEGRP